VTTAADTAEAQTVTHTYDARDWRVATRNAAGATTEFVYDVE
jgi:YD repeat-containing protein